MTEEIWHSSEVERRKYSSYRYALQYKFLWLFWVDHGRYDSLSDAKAHARIWSDDSIVSWRIVDRFENK